MKRILMLSGHEVIVDDDDFMILNKHKWTIHSEGYAINTSICGRTLYMHRLIMGPRGSKQYIDHINHDKLDNRKENLRFATNSQNQFNRKSKHVLDTGVCWHIASKKWRSRIKVNGKEIHLGVFSNKEFAIEARHNALRKYGIIK